MFVCVGSCNDEQLRSGNVVVVAAGGAGRAGSLAGNVFSVT